ncbi:MAG TPA: ComEA family DNA-binding protein [Gemmatimonadales bacterium]|jgi:competence ComEA-like helix-hairpin-helix protein|nr:ComEA family DNA-binding protein [Gemmatimonadales bacterium]
MATISRRERRLLALLLGLGLTGHLLTAFAASPAASPAAVALLDPARDGNPAAHQDSIRHLSRPLGPDERIDVNRAPVEELERLPGVGASLAKKIVAVRENLGLFSGITGLHLVRGIGPALLARLAPHLTFSGMAAEAPQTPAGEPVDLNRASAAELGALPGVGAAKARAIIAFRDSLGPFRQITDLMLVPGISAALVKRMAGRLVIQ